jgi:hypothetical protein
MNKSVQEDLKLEKGQVEKIQAALQKVRDSHPEDFEKLRDRNTGREERIRLMQKINEANAAAVREVLTPGQMTRVGQIQNQQRGAALFEDPDVQKSLKLSDEQKGKIKALNDDLRREMREIMQGVRGNPEGFADAMKKLNARRKETMEKVLAVLNAEQKKAAKKMLGEPFEVRFEAPRTGP